MTQIKAVIFDAFSTLFSCVDITPFRDLFLRLYPLDPSLSEGMIAKVYRNHELEFSKGQGDDYLRWYNILRDLAISLPDEALSELIYHCLVIEAVNVIKNARLLPGALSVPRELINRGFSIGICSNGSAPAKYLETQIFGFDRIFDAFVISCDVGYTKADDEIFLLAAQQLGRKPSECLYVDDGNEHCTKAKNLGFTTCLAVQAEVNDRIDPDDFDDDPGVDLIIESLPELLELPILGG